MVDGEKVDQTRRAINLSLPQGHGSQATTMPGWRARRGGTLLTIVVFFRRRCVKKWSRLDTLGRGRAHCRRGRDAEHAVHRAGTHGCRGRERSLCIEHTTRWPARG